MRITKKHIALALAGAALAQALAYAGYQWVKFPADKGGSMTEREEGQARMEQQRAQEKIERWRTHPQEEGNPEWMIPKILRGRAPDDATLTDYEMTSEKMWRTTAEQERRIASGESGARWTHGTLLEDAIEAKENTEPEPRCTTSIKAVVCRGQKPC